MKTNKPLLSLVIVLTIAIVTLPVLYSSSTAVPPAYSSREEITNAIGYLDSYTPEIQRAFTANADFKPLPMPGENDWLALYPEPAQTFLQFVQSKPNKPKPPENVIYFQPLDAFAGRDPDELEILKTFAEAYFQLSVVMQQPIDVRQYGITERKNPNAGQRQLLTTDIMKLLRRGLPSDAYCRLGITTIDLYPQPSWNFVFGQAYLKERTGVYSFARYAPEFYGQAAKPDDDKLALLRSFKVLAHETGHMFGVEHCIYLLCLMNGSNHLEETDNSPLHFCPVCLRKLQRSLGFDVVERYHELEAVYGRVGLGKQGDWVKRRAAYIQGN